MRVAVTAHHAADVEPLRAAGADLVLQPFADAAEEAARLLTAAMTPPPGRPAGVHQPAAEPAAPGDAP